MEPGDTRRVEDARPLALIASLTSVRQIAGSFTMHRPPEEKMSLDLHVGDVEHTRSNDALVVSIPFHLNGHLAAVSADAEAGPGSDAEAICFEIEATILLAYDIPNGESFPDESVAAFSSTNAIYNAWPYWREYVHASVRRAEYPPLIVPVLRIVDGQLMIGNE